MLADDLYVLTSQTLASSGTAGTYTESGVTSDYKFTNTSGTVYTYTVSNLPSGGFYFRLYDASWTGTKEMQPYTNNDAITINGDSYTISQNCYGSSNAWHVSYTDGTYSSLTITVDLSTSNRYVKITGTTASSGSNTSTSGDESADNSTTESTTDGYGMPADFGGIILRYNSTTTPTAGTLYDLKQYFDVAYLTPDSKSMKSTFAPYFSYLIKDVASNSEKEDGWSGYVVSMSQSTHPLSLSAYGKPKFLIGNWNNSSATWTVDNELTYTSPYLKKISTSYAGMLDFPLRTFMYNIEQGTYKDASAAGWQALTKMSQISSTDNKRSSIIGKGNTTTDAIYNRLGVTFVNNDKITNITGDENIRKAYAVILTTPGTPVVNYSDLSNTNLSENILRLAQIRKWAGVTNTSTFADNEDKDKNYAYDYHVNGKFAELKVVVGEEAYIANYEKNGNNNETSGGTEDRNNAKFGGDGYNYTLLAEGTGWRVWYNNGGKANAIHVALSPESGYKKGTVNCTGQVIGIAGSGERKFAYTTNGTAPTLNDDGSAGTGSTIVTYTWNSTTESGKIGDFSASSDVVVNNGGYVTVIAQAIQNGALVGACDTVTYRFSDYTPLSIKINPGNTTLNYGTSIAPIITVVDPNNPTSGEKYLVYSLTNTLDLRPESFTDPTSTISFKQLDGTTTADATGYFGSYTADGVVDGYMPGTLTYDAENDEILLNDEPIDQTATDNDGNKWTYLYAWAIRKTTDKDNNTIYKVEGLAVVTYTFLSPTSSDLSYKVEVVNDSLTQANVTPVTANRATFTVTAYNTSDNSTYTKDTTVPVYYTTDGSDPTSSFTRRLVRNRKITVYAGNSGTTGTVRVAIAGAPQATSAKMRAKQRRSSSGAASTPSDLNNTDSAPYDITYSTSEAGYLNYLNNSKSDTLLYGGKGHVVVYARYTGSTDNTLPCVFAYANTAQSDGTMKAEILTPFPAYTFTTADAVTVGGNTWYKIDLEPTSGFQEVNFKVGACDTTAENPGDAVTLAPIIIAHADKDVFFEIADNDSTKSSAPYRITDVTRQYTGNFFYTVNATTGVTIKARVNPSSTSSESFIYVEVPEEWVTDGNSLKVYNGETELSPSIDVQGSAETAAATKLCKVTFTTAPTDGDSLTFKPYNGTTTSTRFSFAAAYHNGGYYRYIPPYTATETSEDGTETTNTYNDSGCYLIFSPYTDDETTDQRPTGKIDINHTSIGNPYDKTYLLNSEWTSSSAAAKTRASESTTVTTTAITDNWNGAASTNVYAIASGTTYTQTASGLTASTPYTVQMIVRGESGATGTMTLTGTDSKTATSSFSGYTSTGTITKDGRVDSLYTDITNGWHKLEATATSSSTGTLTISLAATSGPLQLSDVTLLENANTAGHVWTSAPTSSSVTEYDLSSRSNANAYSFFDRGINHNAIVYVDANTVVGRDANALDIAAATTSSSTTTYSMAKLALTDTDGKQTIAGYATNSNAFKITKSYVTAKNITYDRDFNTGMSTLCLPFALTNADLVNMGISKVYTFNGMSESSSNIYKVDFTEQDVSSSSSISTEGGKPYIVKFSEAKSTGFALTDANKTIATGDAGQQVSTDGDIFQGVYKLDSIPFNQWDSEAISMRYWIYNGSTKDGDLGKFVPARYKDEGTKTILNPFRGYFIVKAANQAKVRSLIFSIHTGDRTTDIDAVEFMHGDLTAPVYNLSGQMVQRVGNIGSLPKGVYIQNHKKFVVR